MANEEYEDYDDDELVEIDLEALEGTVDLWHDAGLDLSDNEEVFAHSSALLAMVLRRVHRAGQVDEEDLATIAAEAAAFAVEVALGDDDLPEFVPSEEIEEN